MRLRLVACVVTTSSACAFTLQSTPPKPPVRARPDCASHLGWAAADGAFAAIAGISAVAFLQASTADPAEIEPAKNVALGFFVASALWTGTHVVSGAGGLRDASRCRDAHAAWHALDVAEQMRLTPPLPPNPKNNPNQAWAFWCNASGNCVADEAACGAGCLRTPSVWCAYASGGQHHCAVDETSCRRIAREQRVTGRCDPRAAKLSPPPGR